MYEADYHWTFEYRRGTNGFMDDSGRWIDTNNTLVFLFSWKVMKQWQIGKRLCLCRLHGYIPTAWGWSSRNQWWHEYHLEAHSVATSQKPHLMGHTDIPTAFWYGRFLGWLWLHCFFLSKGHTFLVSKGVYCLIRSKRVPCLENPTTIPPPSTLPQAKRGLMTSEFLKFSCKSQPQKRRQLSYKFTTPTWNKERERESTCMYLQLL